MTSRTIHLGIIGVCGRGASFKAGCDAAGLHIQAVCDTNAKALPHSREKLGAEQAFTDYRQMLDEAVLDAVIVASPMHLHVPMCIDALRRGLHVLSEVPAGVSIDECRELTLTVRRSDRVYMMAENFNYIWQTVLVRELVRQGLFGQTYYAEGEYLHEHKAYNETTPWRRRWQTGVNGNTYPTHSLGPILQWMPGDRVVSVCCVGSGHHYTDPRGDTYENEDTTLTLCRTAAGNLIKLRLDMLSQRPDGGNRYHLQGTAGCYESPRTSGERYRVWLESRCKDPSTWLDLADLADEFLPEPWRGSDAIARTAGHGGGDYYQVLDFARAVRGEQPSPVDIDAAMDLTLPGLVSQLSIARQSTWLDVPDPRTWR